MPLHAANPARECDERWVWLYTRGGRPEDFAARYTLDELQEEHRGCREYFLAQGRPLNAVLVESLSGDGGLGVDEYLDLLSDAILLAQPARV